MKKISLMLLLAMVSLGVFGQVVTNQPSIVVVPFIKQGQDYRTIYEDDPNMRVVMATICDAFNSRMASSTKDFVQLLQAQSQSSEVYGEGTQRDLKAMVAELSDADIYVIAEIQTNFASSGNSVKVLLKACDVSNGDVLSNKVGYSGELYSNDVGALATRAMARVSEEFLNDIQNSFNRIALEGRTLSVDFRIAEGVDMDFSTEIGKDEEELGDLIGDWIEDNAYKNNFGKSNVTDFYITFPGVKIPIRDEDGNNYSPRNFGRSLRNFLKGLGIKAKVDQLGYTCHVIITGLKE